MVRCAVMSKKATRTTIGNNVSLTIIQYLRMPLQLLNLKKLAYNVTSQANLGNRRNWQYLCKKKNLICSFFNSFRNVF